MYNYFRQLKPLLFGVLLLAGSVPAAFAAIPGGGPAAANQGTARVWFLRPGSSSADIWGASPMIYANGSPVAAIPPESAFYRDYAPGTYSFSVEPYGTPTGNADTVRLSPGSQTYLNVQWVQTWEMGYPSTGRGSQSHSFFVVNMAPQLAQAYLPTLKDLGRV